MNKVLKIKKEDKSLEDIVNKSSLAFDSIDDGSKKNKKRQTNN